MNDTRTISKFILWDFDETLAYREGRWTRCIATIIDNRFPDLGATREALAPFLKNQFPWHAPQNAHLHIRDADSWWNWISPTLENAISSAFGLPSAISREIAIEVRHAYLDPAFWVVYPDVKPCLESLKIQGWKHIILSNHVPELETLVTNLDLRDYFETVHTSALSGYEKPHPESFRVAIRELPPHSHCVMVGDNYRADILGAEAIGLHGILVRKPHLKANYFLDDLRDLPLVLNQTLSFLSPPATSLRLKT